MKTLSTPRKAVISSNGTSQIAKNTADTRKDQERFGRAWGRGFLSEQRVFVPEDRAAPRLVAAANSKQRRTGTAPDIADDTGREDDQRERNPEEEDGDEGGCRDVDHQPVLERPTTYPENGMDDDGEDCGLQSEEQPVDNGDIAEGGVDVT